MSKAGKRLLRGAYQALAYAEGRAEPGTYRIHHPDNSKAETSEPRTDLGDARIATDSDMVQATVTGNNKTWTAVEKEKAKFNASVTGQ